MVVTKQPFVIPVANIFYQMCFYTHTNRLVNHVQFITISTCAVVLYLGLVGSAVNNFYENNIITLAVETAELLSGAFYFFIQIYISYNITRLIHINNMIMKLDSISDVSRLDDLIRFYNKTGTVLIIYLLFPLLMTIAIGYATFNLYTMCLNGCASFITFYLPIDYDHFPINFVIVILQCILCVYGLIFCMLLIFIAFLAIRGILFRIELVEEKIIQLKTIRGTIAKRRQFGILIQFHSDTLDSLEVLRKFMDRIVFFGLLLAAINTSLIIFTLIQEIDYIQFFHLHAYNSLIIMLAYMAEMLASKNDKLYHSIFHAIEWKDPRLALDMQFMIHRCSKTPVLTAGTFSAFRAPSALKIYKFIYSLIMCIWNTSA